ncbi:hypothetical protein H4219_004761 [Mycoemilia scoparia]|uniref:Uncharacterized protein n=1 Tax=Mycoemilia scoparia TaxID=417184 RepID=A0A9W8DRB5_9FUNG|nr:hypothetical protein H4219_004761 [Mycoemilia scoparia]
MYNNSQVQDRDNNYSNNKDATSNQLPYQEFQQTATDGLLFDPSYISLPLNGSSAFASQFTNVFANTNEITPHMMAVGSNGVSSGHFQGYGFYPNGSAPYEMGPDSMQTAFAQQGSIASYPHHQYPPQPAPMQPMMTPQPPPAPGSAYNGYPGASSNMPSSGATAVPNNSGIASKTASTTSLATTSSSGGSFKNTTRRITLNAYQQLVTLQFFYDQYPEDTYSDEDLFRLSYSCGLDFELTKRRLANLNGKQRDLRNALFTTDIGHNYDFIVELLAQLEKGTEKTLFSNALANALTSFNADGNTSSPPSPSPRKQKRSRITLSLEASLFRNMYGEKNDYGTSFADELSSRKRAGKDEKVLVELHHREVLGVGFNLAQCYVLGQGKVVKDWLFERRNEVQEWLFMKFGPANVPQLLDPCRPYYAPTTPSDLMESDMAMAYLQYTSSLRPKRNLNNGVIGNSSMVDGLGQGNGGSSSGVATSNGGGWLSSSNKSSSSSSTLALGGSSGHDPSHFDTTVPMNPTVSMHSDFEQDHISSLPMMMMSNPMHPSISGNSSLMGMQNLTLMTPSNSSSMLAAAGTSAGLSTTAFKRQSTYKLCMHAGASIFISPNESIEDELKTVTTDLLTVLSRSTEPVISGGLKNKSIGSVSNSASHQQESGNLDGLFTALYLWLHPKIVDQSAIRSELTLKEPMARNPKISLIDQVTQIITELRSIKKLPAAMILTLGVLGLEAGGCGLILMINKTANHPLYILPGVSPKSVGSSRLYYGGGGGGGGGGHKRKRCMGASPSNDECTPDELYQKWQDDWLLVQDRKTFALKSDMLFIRRGSFASATAPRPGNSSSDDKLAPGPPSFECTIQPTDAEAANLATQNLDIVGRPWKGLDPTGSDITGSSIAYHFKRTVALDDLSANDVAVKADISLFSSRISNSSSVSGNGKSALKEPKSAISEFPEIAVPDSPNRPNSVNDNSGNSNNANRSNDIGNSNSGAQMGPNATNDVYNSINILQSWLSENSLSLDASSPNFISQDTLSNILQSISESTTSMGSFAPSLSSISMSRNMENGGDASNIGDNAFKKLAAGNYPKYLSINPNDTTITKPSNNNMPASSSEQQRSISLNENLMTNSLCSALYSGNNGTSDSNANTSNDSESPGTTNNNGLQTRRTFSFNDTSTVESAALAAANSSYLRSIQSGDSMQMDLLNHLSQSIIANPMENVTFDSSKYQQLNSSALPSSVTTMWANDKLKSQFQQQPLSENIGEGMVFDPMATTKGENNLSVVHGNNDMMITNNTVYNNNGNTC